MGALRVADWMFLLGGRANDQRDHCALGAAAALPCKKISETELTVGVLPSPALWCIGSFAGDFGLSRCLSGDVLRSDSDFGLFAAL